MEQLYTISEFAKETGTTVRTLRYYHKKKLLVPSAFNAQGHRLYSQKDLFLYQRIITFKYVGYSLDQIADFLDNPELNLAETLAFQKRMLVEKQKRLQRVIDSLETVESVLQEDGEADPYSILTFIQTYHQAEERRSWWSSFLSPELVEVLFSLETQKKYWLLLIEMSKLQKKHPPSSKTAQEKMMSLYKQVDALFTPEMLAELEENADHMKKVPPFLMDEISIDLVQYMEEIEKEMRKHEK